MKRLTILLFIVATLFSCECDSQVPGIGGTPFIAGGGGASTMSFVGYSSVYVQSNLTVTITAPDNIEAGDLLIATFSNSENGANTITGVPTGWTLVTQLLTSSVLCSYTYMKTATASEPSDYTFTKSSSFFGYWAVVCSVFRDSETGTWAVADTATNYSNTDVYTSGAVDCADNCLYLFSLCVDGARTIDTPPSDMTEVYGVTGVASNFTYYSFQNSESGITKSITSDSIDEAHTMAVVITHN
ncbi:MAG: hypothetical protein OEY01_11170 [Desulfobulbaceae bacterium]|nr:hypothetical protein [Desulfobulbaceae bacterium]